MNTIVLKAFGPSRAGAIVVVGLMAGTLLAWLAACA